MAQKEQAQEPTPITKEEQEKIIKMINKSTNRGEA